MPWNGEVGADDVSYPTPRRDRLFFRYPPLPIYRGALHSIAAPAARRATRLPAAELPHIAGPACRAAASELARQVHRKYTAHTASPCK